MKTLLITTLTTWAVIATLVTAFEFSPLMHGYTDFRVARGDAWELVEAGYYDSPNECCADNKPKYRRSVVAYVAQVSTDGKCYWYAYNERDAIGLVFLHCAPTKELWYYNHKLIARIQWK